MVKKFHQYKHAVFLLYFPIYLLAFCYLEKNVPDKLHIINCSLDQYIPFLEIFVVPYLLWFVYIAAAGAYFFFKEKESFKRWMCFGMIGMTTFLIVSWLYPNGLELRPETFARDNIFTQLTQMVYSMDTPTNVLPSIHVFNSVGVYFAVKESPGLRDKRGVHRAVWTMSVLIILSTVFLKQHSIVDVLTALVLSYFAYDLVYNERFARIRAGMEMLRYQSGKRYSRHGKQRRGVNL